MALMWYPGLALEHMPKFSFDDPNYQIHLIKAGELLRDYSINPTSARPYCRRDLLKFFHTPRRKRRTTWKALVEGYQRGRNLDGITFLPWGFEPGRIKVPVAA